MLAMRRGATSVSIEKDCLIEDARISCPWSFVSVLAGPGTNKREDRFIRQWNLMNLLPLNRKPELLLVKKLEGRGIYKFQNAANRIILMGHI